jgi:hypothetical protein
VLNSSVSATCRGPAWGAWCIYSLDFIIYEFIIMISSFIIYNFVIYNLSVAVVISIVGNGLTVGLTRDAPEPYMAVIADCQ